MVVNMKIDMTNKVLWIIKVLSFKVLNENLKAFNDPIKDCNNTLKLNILHQST
jgi:hypothetical protein